MTRRGTDTEHLRRDEELVLNINEVFRHLNCFQKVSLKSDLRSDLNYLSDKHSEWTTQFYRVCPWTRDQPSGKFVVRMCQSSLAC